MTGHHYDPIKFFWREIFGVLAFRVHEIHCLGRLGEKNIIVGAMSN